MMKTLLTLFVLLFSSSVVAEDISDFQIEEMSIGDNALDFFSSTDIDNAYDESYPDRKFLLLTIYKSLGPYEIIQISVKANDPKYKLYGIMGLIPYRTDINACYKKKNIIVKDLSQLFKNVKIKDWGRLDNPPLSDAYGGTYDLVTFDFDNGRVQVSCNDWSELSNIIDSVKVEIISVEYKKYLEELLY